MIENPEDPTSDGAYTLSRPAQLLPLTRHLSYPLTLFLLKLPISPNQVTALSLAAGLAGAWYFSLGTMDAGLIGGLLLIACYTLDNCDGEIARLKNLSSEWGAQFDDLADWLVDGAFFAGLGFGVSAATGEAFWLWLGLAATAGATIDYGIDLIFHARAKQDPAQETREETARGDRKPEDVLDWLIYIFHKLSRADFCVIVFGLALFDVTWVLLPLGAIGAQAYWVTDLFQRARGWHT
ncbi:MAG: CDP-alcohol phosphatidyltransferase family protein [Rhodospirillales bacterium]|nr:CDP-alcohol phosphatidyltransferase family protein [Rhodospirillales bacterium]